MQWESLKYPATNRVKHLIPVEFLMHTVKISLIVFTINFPNLFNLFKSRITIVKGATIKILKARGHEF